MAPNLTDAQKNQIVGLSMAGKSTKEIMEITGASKSGVNAILKKWRENGSVDTKPRPGRPVSKNTAEMRNRVRQKVARDPKRTVAGLAREENVSRRTLKRGLDKMGMKSKKPLVRHMIFPGQEKKRLERAMNLLDWRENHSNVVVLWTDEKWFYVEQHVNRQNDRFILSVGAQDDDLRTVKLEKNPDKVMVFGLVASDGQFMPPILFPKGISINSNVYKELVLSKVIPWMKERWAPGQAVLMQNGAPAHTSNATQKYLEDELGKEGFWDKKTWPPSSPDCNPLDFSTWSRLAASIGETKPRNRQDLIERIEGRWGDILNVDYVIKTCQGAWERLRRVVDADGSYIRPKESLDNESDSDSG